MNITNSNQIIDKETIFRGCNQLEEAFQDFTSCAKFVEQAAYTCSPQALSVENSSMQPVLEEVASNLYTYEKSIHNITDSIRNAVQKRYNQEVAAYESYLAELKAQEEAALAAEQTDSTII